MRNHAYKGKSTEKVNSGKWITGNLMCCQKSGRAYIDSYEPIDEYKEDYNCEINPDTICQYTGYLDMNETEIWENDIIYSKGTWVERYYGVIKFGLRETSEGMPKAGTPIGFYIDWITPGSKLFRRDLGHWLEKGIYVAGNTFDNPSLLKGD